MSGGFATVQPNSTLSINAVEGYPLEDFSAESVRNQIAEAQKIAGGSGSEQDIAEAKIELEVCLQDKVYRGRRTRGLWRPDTAPFIFDQRVYINVILQVLESLQAALK